MILPPVPDREVEREQADDPVQEAARDEPCPCEHLEGLRVDEVVPRGARAANRSGRVGHPAHRHGTQNVTAFGSTSTLNELDLRPVAAVELVEHLAVQLDLDLPCARRARRTATLGLADGRSCERARPVSDAVGVDDPDLESAVVGTSRAANTSMPPKRFADVADEDAAGLAVVPGGAVDRDLRAEGLRAQVLAIPSRHRRAGRIDP